VGDTATVTIRTNNKHVKTKPLRDTYGQFRMVDRGGDALFATAIEYTCNGATITVKRCVGQATRNPAVGARPRIISFSLG
jgi:hypothetical protein